MSNDITDRIADTIFCVGAPMSRELSRRMAAAVVEDLGLTEEVHPNHPILVPEFHEDGSPVLNEHMVEPTQKHHFEWVRMRRWITPLEEIGERETSEQLAARLEQT